MEKFKLFVENFLVYGVGGIISKIVPLIMVPIITRLMPNTEYYGINDLFNTVCSFAGAIAILGMYDAMYRLFFEREDENYKKDICSTTLIFSIGFSIAVALILVILKDQFAILVFGKDKYSFLICIAAFSVILNVINTIVAAPTRMQNKRTIFLITNTISPILSYALAIPMLISGYYITALPIAGIVALLLISFIFIVTNKNWFAFKRFNKKYLRELLIIGVPLVPNFLIYWIFNSSDRIMLSNIMGLGATGIYSIGAKLGNMSQLIYTAFSGGWLYFAYSTMHEDNQVETNSKVFEYLAVISFACTIFIFVICKPLYSVLFEGDYIEGYLASPYLFLAPLLQMLFQVASNQFMVQKKSWVNMFMLLAGAVFNILLNLLLIPVMGIEGAAIASLLGYAISVILCIGVLKRKKLMVISSRFIIITSIMIFYIILWRLFLVKILIVDIMFLIAIITLFIFFYKKDIQALLKNRIDR